MSYTVDPGLYAMGRPSADTSVFVTANYKMSFDCLRKALSGRDAWILVLNTHGINVWCAAGKGTFGTKELVERIKQCHLSEVVAHRKLVLPQLSGPGISAHRVKTRSGFRVIYGPIRAEDLAVFIDGGYKATEKMRLKRFEIQERAVLIPMELVSAGKTALVVIPCFFLAGGLGGSNDYWTDAVIVGLFAAVCWLMAIAAGALVAPLLLPWLPGRTFSVKGLTVGLMAWAALALSRQDLLATGSGKLEMLSWLFLMPAAAAYLSMNFTGASTYTSLSGVKKEMRWAVPMEIAAAVLGLVLWVGARFST